jgi:hypothetical protein
MIARKLPTKFALVFNVGKNIFANLDLLLILFRLHQFCDKKFAAQHFTFTFTFTFQLKSWLKKCVFILP